MKQKTETWLRLAEEDLSFAQDLIKREERYHYAIHFCHQAIEKILKAIVQEYANEAPKRTHSFKVLWEQASIPLSNEQKETLLDIMPHYIGARYPEDIRELHKTYSKNFAEKILLESEELFKWFKIYLKSKKQ